MPEVRRGLLPLGKYGSATSVGALPALSDKRQFAGCVGAENCANPIDEDHVVQEGKKQHNLPP